ncbi:MAG: mechanosensitive ion channel [Tissierellia bacterium]|nr:mechanosensitive ion channel [Tissierellia bacterium]
MENWNIRLTNMVPNPQEVEEQLQGLEKYTQLSTWKNIDWTSLGLRLLTGLIFFTIGYYLIKLIIRLIRSILERQGVTKGMIYFLTRTLRFILLFILITVIAGTLGIKTTSLVALIGSLGIAVGLALQGSLSDLASGIMLVTLHPIRVGDYVFLEGEDTLLQVHQIRLFNTYFIDKRNFILIHPNSRIIKNKIQNLSKKDFVKFDVEVDIAYSADLEKAKIAITKGLKSNPLILHDQGYLIAVKELKDSGIGLLVRASVRSKDYAIAKLKTTEDIKKLLDEYHIEIPFPQMEVKILHPHSDDSHMIGNIKKGQSSLK